MSYRDIYDRLLSEAGAFQAAVEADVVVDEGNLPREIARQAQVLCHWGRLCVIAEADYLEKKRILEYEVMPLSKIRARAILKEMGEKTSEARIDEEVCKDQNFRNAKEAVDMAYINLTLFKKVEGAIFQKKDMIQSLNKRQHVELDSHPRE